jgi:hypothetical protein
VSEWSDVSTCGLWLQWTSTIKIPTKQSRHSWKIPHWFEKTITRSLIDITNIHDLFKPWYSWNTAKIGVKHQSTNQHQSLLLLLNALCLKGEETNTRFIVIGLTWQGPNHYTIDVVHTIFMYKHQVPLKILHGIIIGVFSNFKSIKKILSCELVIYFISLIIIGSFFVLNLVLGVLSGLVYKSLQGVQYISLRQNIIIICEVKFDWMILKITGWQQKICFNVSG